MYTVYANDELIYHPIVDGLELESANVEMEVNTAGTFKFLIYPNNPYIGTIRKMKTIIKVYDDDFLLFRGRVLDSTRGFYNQQNVICEGELNFLKDSTQRPYKFSGTPEKLFRMFIENHNDYAEPEKQFKVGKVTVTDPNDYITRSDSRYLNTLESIKEKLIKPLGGFLFIRHESDGNYIDYLEDFTTINDQSIRFGENLLDFEEIIKGKDVATEVIPIGAKLKDLEGNETDDRLTIETVNNGLDYIRDEEAIEKFGRISKVVEFEDVTLPENLLRKGKEALADSVHLSLSIDLTAADLHALDVEIQSFKMGNYTKIESTPHDYEDLLLTRKLSINILDPADSALFLGDERKTLSDKTVEAGKNTSDLIERVEIVEKDYEINKPMIDQVLNRLTLAIERNHPLNQSYNPNTDVYVPDYTDQPLRLTPIAKYRAQEVKCKIIWKRVVDDEELELEAGETVNPDDGVLTITKNFGTEYRTYKCYATYTLNTSNYVVNAKIDFNKVNEGLNGETGVPGAPGKDGRTSYFHIKYSMNANGHPMIEDPATYIGIYVDFEEADSTDPARYTWAKFEGMDGAQGIPGENGEDGRTTYLHIAYADSEDGTLNFDIQNSAGKLYIGQYTDFEPMDSTNPHDYKWSKIKGEDGVPGKDSAIQSPTEPEDKTLLWLDTSVTPPLLKQWNGEEWVIVNDVTEEIKSLREELKSEINQESDGIRFEVAQNYYTKGEAEQLQSSVNTQFEQSKKDFEFKFNEFNKDLTDLENGTNAEFQNIQKYIRFEDGNIEMGMVGNEFKRLLTRTKDSYLQNGVEIAYFGNRKLYVTDGEFISSCMFGNFGFFPEENESLSFRKAR